MSQVFVLVNQHQLFLSKSNEWVDGRESNRLFCSEHKDIAINQMFEANTRDIEQRIKLLQCPLNAKGRPQVPSALDAALQLSDPGVDPSELPPQNPPEVPPQQVPELEPQTTPEWESPSVPEVDPQPETIPNESPEN